MANIKEVVIEGYLEHDAGGNEDLIKLLGTMNLPVFGLRITYDEMKRKMIPNRHGGMSALYGFKISGMEAVRDEWISYLLQMLAKAAEITVAKYRDYENNSGWRNMMMFVDAYKP